MKIFLDTANREEIERWSTTGVIDGVTTNPTLLSKEKGDPLSILKDIIELLPEGEVSVEVTEKNPEKVYKQAYEIAKLGSNVLVKIPCAVEYYEAISHLSKDGVPLNITLVFTLIQSLMMSKLDVEYISPFMGRLEDKEIDAIATLSDIKHMQMEYGFSTAVLAASIRSVNHVHHAIQTGADAITMPPDIFAKAVENSLTREGMKKFDEDWKQLKIKKFP